MSKITSFNVTIESAHGHLAGANRLLAAVAIAHDQAVVAVDAERLGLLRAVGAEQAHRAPERQAGGAVFAQSVERLQPVQLL